MHGKKALTGIQFSTSNEKKVKYTLLKIPINIFGLPLWTRLLSPLVNQLKLVTCRQEKMKHPR